MVGRRMPDTCSMHAEKPPMRISALVPARSVSKGLQNKNMLEIGGQPLLSTDTAMRQEILTGLASTLTERGSPCRISGYGRSRAHGRRKSLSTRPESRRPPVAGPIGDVAGGTPTGVFAIQLRPAAPCPIVRQERRIFPTMDHPINGLDVNDGDEFPFVKAMIDIQPRSDVVSATSWSPPGGPDRSVGREPNCRAALRMADQIEKNHIAFDKRCVARFFSGNAFPLFTIGAISSKGAPVRERM